MFAGRSLDFIHLQANARHQRLLPFSRSNKAQYIYLGGSPSAQANVVTKEGLQLTDLMLAVLLLLEVIGELLPYLKLRTVRRMTQHNMNSSFLVSIYEFPRLLLSMLPSSVDLLPLLVTPSRSPSR